MFKPFFITLLSITALTACSQNVVEISDRTSSACGDKPNCVSTQDPRDQHSLAPFALKEGVSIDQVERIAVLLPGAKTATINGDYLRVECTSAIMRFVDDLELKIEGTNLIVRSESRVGHSDFGVNRERVNSLRLLLISENLIIAQ